MKLTILSVLVFAFAFATVGCGRGEQENYEVPAEAANVKGKKNVFDLSVDPLGTGEKGRDGQPVAPSGQ